MATTGKTNVAKTPRNVETSRQMDGYSGVRIIVGTDENGADIGYFAGATSGLVLEFENPFGTQAMADNILTRIRGYQYQPLRAEGALLDPAAELGDGVSANDIYSGIFSRDTTYNSLMASDISAPGDEEVVHEYSVEPESERKFKRFQGETKAQISITSQQISSEVTRATAAEGDLGSRITQTAEDISLEVTRATAAEGTLSTKITQQATEISAKVSATGGSNASFGWKLTTSEFYLYSNSSTVLSCTKKGLAVSGKITATSGKIGGFTIGSSAIYNKISSFGGAGTDGVYIGTNGIQLGSKFRVTSGGVVRASELNIVGGSINIGTNVTPDNVTQDGVTYVSWAFVKGESAVPQIKLASGAAIDSVSGLKIGNTTIPSSGYTITNGVLKLNSSYLNARSAGSYVVTGTLYYDIGIGLLAEISFTSPTLTIYSEARYFRVDSSGNVTASSLKITGGSINIGNNFRVDSSGNVTANNGTFKGDVYAGNIQYGGTAGYFDGGGIGVGTIDGSAGDDWTGTGGAILAGSIDTSAVEEAINNSLAYANFSDSVFSGYDTATYLSCNYLKVLGDDYVPTTVTFRVTNSSGTYNGALTLTVLAKAPD